MNGGGRADDENEGRCDEGDINRTENQMALFLCETAPVSAGFQITQFS